MHGIISLRTNSLDLLTSYKFEERCQVLLHADKLHAAGAGVTYLTKKPVEELEGMLVHSHSANPLASIVNEQFSSQAPAFS